MGQSRNTRVATGAGFRLQGGMLTVSLVWEEKVGRLWI